jgi:cytochrome c556
MTRFFLATASLALLAGCDAQTAPPAQNQTANAATAEQNIATPAAPMDASAPLGAQVSREQALQLMEERHEGMEEIGDAMKLITRELRGDTPDLAKVREGAATINRLAPEVSGWFPPGSGPEIDETEAKAEIWQKPEDFAAKRNAFQQSAQAFNAAAQGNDVAAIRAAHAELGKTCKACHDLYREEDH